MNDILALRLLQLSKLSSFFRHFEWSLHVLSICGLCEKKIIFEDNQKPIIFEVSIIIALSGIDQSDFIEKNNLIFSKKNSKNRR